MSLGEPIFLAIQRGYSVETRIVENENEIVCLFVMMMEIGIKKKIEKFSEWKWNNNDDDDDFEQFSG